MAYHTRTIVSACIVFSAMLSIGAQSRSTQYLEMRQKPRVLFDVWAASMNRVEARVTPPAERFASLPVSRRSTYAAATNALYNTKLTDRSGRSLGLAIDLVAEIREIAGEEAGKGSDEQFRLYVKLKNGAIATLEKSREFSRGKDNTIFHKGYPINFRQSGNTPTMQFSIATDGKLADIDVDYRSSKFPSALFNGHLSAANSDVRASGNYPTHIKRWFGLREWWDTEFPDLVAEFTRMAQKSVPVELLPPTGHEHAPDADRVAKVADAFLRIWLIDRDTERAMDFVKNELTFCTEVKDLRERRLLNNRDKLLFLDTLKLTNKELKNPKSLDSAIRAVAPIDPWIKPVDHFNKKTYTLSVITDGDYHHFVCASKVSNQSAAPNADHGRSYGKHYVTKFQFIHEKGTGGIMRLLWTQDAKGVWKIEAFDAVTA